MDQLIVCLSRLSQDAAAVFLALLSRYCLVLRSAALRGIACEEGIERWVSVCVCVFLSICVREAQAANQKLFFFLSF